MKILGFTKNMKIQIAIRKDWVWHWGVPSNPKVSSMSASVQVLTALIFIDWGNMYQANCNTQIHLSNSSLHFYKNNSNCIISWREITAIISPRLVHLHPLTAVSVFCFFHTFAYVFEQIFTSIFVKLVFFKHYCRWMKSYLEKNFALKTCLKHFDQHPKYGF